MKPLTLIVPALLALASPAYAQDSTQPMSVPEAEPQTLARQVAAKLLPDGTLLLAMKSVTDQATGHMMDQLLNMPLSDFARRLDVPQEKIANTSKATLRQALAIMDPAFEERAKISTRVMMSEIGTFMSAMEPEVRAGLADGLAANFTTTQLHDLDTFFSTPAGSAYASKSYLLYTSPEMMQRVQAMVPKLVAAMPTIFAKMQAATASLPKPRTPEDLTPQQRQQIKALLGAPERK